MSTNDLVERPSTAFHPGTSFPFSTSSSAYSFTSFAHFSRSCACCSISPISVLDSMADSAKAYFAKSRLATARALQIAFALQNLQCSPGTQSPSPLKAFSARGFTNSSPHLISSSDLISHSDIESRRGCTIDILIV